MDTALVMVTVPSAAEARTLGRALVEARLAASVNIAPGITSFYWWDGAVREGAEALLFAKTRETTWWSAWSISSSRATPTTARPSSRRRSRRATRTI